MINGDSKLYPEEYQVPFGNKAVVMQSMQGLVQRFAGFAARVDHAGEIEVLIPTDDGWLEWFNVTDSELEPAASVRKSAKN